jgi:hypothetical protein
MQPSDWIALASVATAVLLSIVTVMVNSRLHRSQQEWEDRARREEREREDRARREERERERALSERHREDTPHVEFTLDCESFGPEEDHFLVEVLLFVHNRDLVQQKFKSILLRIRGIKRDQTLAFREGNKSRLSFPERILDDEEVVPKNYNFLFVEPGVRQTISYVTKVHSSIKYVVVFAEFRYDRFTPHTVERVFHLTPAETAHPQVHGRLG